MWLIEDYGKRAINSKYITQLYLTHERKIGETEEYYYRIMENLGAESDNRSCIFYDHEKKKDETEECYYRIVGTLATESHNRTCVFYETLGPVNSSAHKELVYTRFLELIEWLNGEKDEDDD